MYKWHRLVFTDLYPTTDIWKYRSMAELLVPWKNEINRFRIVSNTEITDFYIGSSGIESLSMMRSFFKRLYSVNLEPVDGPLDEPYPLRNFILIPGKPIRQLYSKSLVQNLANLHTIEGNELVSDFAMYRKGRDKILVSLRIGTFSDLHKFMGENAYIDRMMKKFSQETRIKIKEVKGIGTFHRAKAFDPNRLINIIRVPDDEDLP